MDISQAAPRRALAEQRVIIAAQALAEKYNIPPEVVGGLSVQQRDPMVKTILVTEATADLLEAILKAPSGKKAPAGDPTPEETVSGLVIDDSQSPPAPKKHAAKKE